LNSSSLGCSVLMLTNLIDISSLEHVVRTGHPNRHDGVFTDCFYPRTGEKIS